MAFEILIPELVVFNTKVPKWAHLRHLGKIIVGKDPATALPGCERSSFVCIVNGQYSQPFVDQRVDFFEKLPSRNGFVLGEVDVEVVLNHIEPAQVALVLIQIRGGAAVSRLHRALGLDCILLCDFHFFDDFG